MRDGRRLVGYLRWRVTWAEQKGRDLAVDLVVVAASHPVGSGRTQSAGDSELRGSTGPGVKSNHPQQNYARMPLSTRQEALLLRQVTT